MQLAPRVRVVARWCARILVVLVLVPMPFALALAAVGHAPPAQIEIAGQEVSVRPVVGQDRSLLFGGALVQPSHARILGKDVGVDVDADWNRLVPSDKRTRRYLGALWENPEPAVHLIESSARQHLLGWAAGGFGVGLGALALTFGLLLQRRRRLRRYTPDQVELVTTHNRRLRRTLAVVGVLAALAVDAAGAQVYLHEDQRRVVGDPAFAGTALEGTEVKGLLADVLPFLSIFKPRSTFYDRVADNLTQAVADRPTAVRGEGEVVFVAAEDFEDVNGMARQVGLAAQLVDANFVALSGDLTFAGKSVETYVLDTLDYYAGDRPVYFAPGLHDTHLIVDAARARGWHIADGRTHEVDGLHLLAVPDPRISTVGNFGSGDVLRNPDVDTETAVKDAIREACDTLPDIVLLHDHLLGRRIAEAGCIKTAVVDGRSYQMVGPQPVITRTGGVLHEFTLGSAGGHVSTKPNPGVIDHPARFAIFYLQPDTGAAEYSVVTVQPDASVTITPRAPLTRAYSAD